MLLRRSNWRSSGPAWPSRTRSAIWPRRCGPGARARPPWCRRRRARARRPSSRRCWPTSPCRAAGRTGAGSPRIIVTQPRRVAARSAARRLAALDGSRLGDRVGYTVRGERQAGPGTLIEFVTPGILLNRLLADPGLETTDAVILDEVHERGLETDLLLGMLTEVRQLRGDLTLVAMSATLDAPRFAALIGDGRRRRGPRRRRPGARRRLSVRAVSAGRGLGPRGGAAAG